MIFFKLVWVIRVDNGSKKETIKEQDAEYFKTDD